MTSAAHSRRRLGDSPTDRIGVFLTNALTGWEPPKGPKKQLVFSEFQAERDAAERVKRKETILVILGNPPYNGFAGIAAGEERDLKEAYRHSVDKALPEPEGQGLNELYVRFFRMAERRIVDQTGYGVICFISNYSWLKGRSHPAMRERYLSAFDRISIDSLNGDKLRTGKETPEGLRDPSVFSTESNPEGIGVGTAVSLLVRKKDHSGKAHVFFRDLWGTKKRAQLAADSVSGGGPYAQLESRAEVRLPFAPAQVSGDYLTWPKLPDLFALSSPGINTSRDPGLIDTDLERLRARISAYFDRSKTDDEIRVIAPSLFIASNRFDPSATRAQLLSLGMQKGHFVPYAYRPFDIRWAFWYPQTKLLDEKRVELFKAFQNKAIFLTSRSQAERSDEGSPFYATRGLPDRHLTRPGSNCFPTRHEVGENSPGRLFGTQEEANEGNFSMSALAFCRDLGFSGLQGEQHLWNHILAIGHSPLYLRENADGIELDWPRIPFPTSPDDFTASSRIGERVLGLLLVEDDVDGITLGRIRPELSEIGSLPLCECPRFDFALSRHHGLCGMDVAPSNLVVGYRRRRQTF
jgi:predicted helicase